MLAKNVIIERDTNVLQKYIVLQIMCAFYCYINQILEAKMSFYLAI